MWSVRFFLFSIVNFVGIGFVKFNVRFEKIDKVLR